MSSLLGGVSPCAWCSANVEARSICRQERSFAVGSVSQVLDCCAPCGRRAKRLRPSLVIEALLKMWELPAQHPEFVADFKLATERENKENPQPASLAFSPNSVVSNLTIHGFQVFRDFAALTVWEYEQVVGGVPQELGKGLHSISVPLNGPGGNNVTLYPVELEKLPEDMVRSCFKVRVWYGNQAVHEEQHLAAQDQLVQSHGANMFEHVVGLNFAARPSMAQPTSNRPPTVASLEREHEEVKLMKASVAEPAMPRGEQASNVDFGDQQDADKPCLETVGVGAGSLGQTKKAKAAAKAQLKMLQQAAGSAAKDKVQKGEKSDAELESASKTKKQQKMDALESLRDEDLQTIAREHLRVGGTSIKSLESLQPVEYLRGLPSAGKQLAAALTGVRSSVAT